MGLSLLFLVASAWLQVTDDAELKTRLRREQELVLSNAVGPIAADEGQAACWRVRVLTFFFLRFL